MALKRDESGRLHIESSLMGESLMRKTLLSETETDEIFRPLPGLSVIKIGGQSIMDRGRGTLFPIIDEIVSARPDHPMLLLTGGGTRSRHAYAIALDLGMSTGILAELGNSISEQNALMLATLLAPHGGVRISHADLVKMPSYLRIGIIPVMAAMPPYKLWELPPEVGRIPPHRTDAGTILTAEVLGTSRCILVKDEQGLYSDDPKRNPQAEFIPEIEVHDLMARDLPDLAVERALLEILANARSVREVLIVNGRDRGALTAALKGDNPGTRIYRE